MRSIESRHSTAKCLCNRVAAHQALGKIIDAIADCNLAIALDGDYMKRYINVKQTYYISLQPLKGVKPILSPNLNTLALVEVIHQSLQLSKLDNGTRDGLDKFLRAASTDPETALHYEFMQDYK
ncbi:7-hydroxymethyl chlorophyll a reductase, chloroplastic, partial [Tanacetum coccineum]